MKKTMIIMLVVALTFVSSSAFAEALASGDVSTIAGGQLRATSPANLDIANMSTNVVIGAQYSGTGYAIDTYHTSGTKAYGTAYDSTAIYWMELGVGGTLTAPSSSDSAEAFPSSDWNEM
jgi:hypothetical protein